MTTPYREQREDRSVTVSVTGRDGRWSWGRGVVQHTEHRRRRRRGRTSWTVEFRRRTVESAVHRDEEATARTRVTQVLGALDAVAWPAGSTVVLELTSFERDFTNSEGTAFAVHECWWGLALTDRGPRSVGTHVRTAEALPAACRELLHRWGQVPQAAEAVAFPRDRQLPPVAAVSLAGAQAGILLHELVGHALEQGDVRPGQTVLPAGVQLVAEPLRAGPFDDEGVRGDAVQVVQDGVVTRAVHARADAGHPSGHAWTGPHGRCPRVRLPDLRLLLDPSCAWAEPGEDRGAVTCRSVRGARYFRGVAVLDADAVAMTGDGETRPLPDVRIVVRSRDLSRARLRGPHEVATEAYTGTCGKDGDLLPSRVSGPAMVLPSCTLIWGRP